MYIYIYVSERDRENTYVNERDRERERESFFQSFVPWKFLLGTRGSEPWAYLYLVIRRGRETREKGIGMREEEGGRGGGRRRVEGRVEGAGWRQWRRDEEQKNGVATGGS